MNTYRFLATLLLAILPLLSTPAQGPAPVQDEVEAESPEPHVPLRVGLYVDRGAKCNGLTAWLSLLHSSPQISPVLLDGARLREGALADLDVIVIPGGNSAVQGATMQQAGRAALMEWLEAGGRYFGTCAGCSLALDRPNSLSPAFLPFARHAATAGGNGLDELPILVTERGEELTGIRAGQHLLRYHGGPVLVPTDPVPGTKCEVIGRWNAEFRPKGGKAAPMLGVPALLVGTRGKGRFFITAGHPEHFPRTRDFIVGGFRYLSGVAPSFSPPVRRLGALSVGFYTPGMAGIEAAEAFVALDRDPEFDVTPVQNEDISSGRLDHLDALVLPPGHPDDYAATLKRSKNYIKSFAARGGVILAFGNGWESAKGIELRHCDDAGGVMEALRALRNAAP